MNIAITRRTLFNTMSAVIPFASKDETREHLISVLFDVSESHRLNIVATDGRALAWAKPITEETAGPGRAFLGIADAKELAKLVRPTRKNADELVNLEVDATQMIVTFDNVSAAYALMHAPSYPPYRQVIPDAADKLATFVADPHYIERAGKACQAYTKGLHTTQGMRINAGGGLDAIRFDFLCLVGDLTIVVMPMRA